MRVSLFEKESRVNVPVNKLFQWHARPGAIERLTPPWAPVKLLWSSGGIEKGARVKFRLTIMKIQFDWEAEHVDYEENRLFRDRQVRGPFAHWTHTHLFSPDGENDSFMKDRIEFQLPFDVPGGFAHRRAEKELERMFDFRHRVVKNDLAAHARTLKRLTVVVSGGSGVIGSHLIPYLRAGGHRVIPLVRRRPVPGSDEIYWDPEKGELDLEEAGPIDAVINLNGANIAGRWTRSRKKRILSSRINSTALLAEKIAAMDRKPMVFLTSSAVGFYGNRKEEIVTEETRKGGGFVSKVCREWEKAARPALDAEVAADRKKGCGGCGEAKSTCHSCLTATRSTARALNKAGAKAGDLVLLSMESSAVFKYAALVYFIPVLGLMIGALAGFNLGAGLPLSPDASTIIFGIIGLAAGFFLLTMISKRIGTGKYSGPVIRNVIMEGKKTA